MSANASVVSVFTRSTDGAEFNRVAAATLSTWRCASAGFP